ncbi:MAG: hypothetical protein PHF70_12375, partial [Opitutales bacterium]|nr:hypothetical protein [Opitutales bacterium]
MIFETIETALEAHPVLSAAIHLGAVTVCLTFFLYLTGTRKKQVESTKDDKTFAYDIEGKSHFRPAKESANRNPSPAAEPGKSLQSNPPAPPPPGIHLPRSAPIRLEVIPEPAAENPSSNAEAAATTDAQDVTQAKDQSPGNIPSSAKPDEKDFTIRFPEGMPPVDTQDTDPVAHHTKEEIAIRIYQIFQGKDAETLIAIDREEHILALNPGAEKLFQYPSHELRGKKIEDIIFLEPGDKTGTPASGSDPFDDDDKQRAKGHAKDGSSFPVGVELEMADRPLGIILVRIHTMDLLLQPGKPVFEDLPAVEPEATRDSASTIGAIAATAAALQPILSQTDSESAEPEAVDLKPIEPVAEEISEAQDTTDESTPQPETTSEPEQADGNIAPSPETEETLEAKPDADGAPVQETEPEAVGSEPEAIPESIPATETASLTEAPSAPVESGPNPVEPTEEATAPEPETPVVEEAESTPQTELSDTNDELTDSETASDTEPESAEPEAADLKPIGPVAEEISEAQDTTDE